MTRTGPDQDPGPRQIERDYLAALRDVLTLETWREIVAQAATAAKEGNPQARAWVTRLVLGAQPMTLTALAVRESLHVSAAGEIEALADAAANELDGYDTREKLGLLGEMNVDRAATHSYKAEQKAKRAARRAQRTAEDRGPDAQGD